MKKILVSIILALALVVTCFTPAAYAASKGGTKKMSVYDSVIKSGNYAYCSTPTGIYKVNIKNKKTQRLIKLNVDEQSVKPVLCLLKENICNTSMVAETAKI